MKKFFTLIAVAMMALSANAKQVIDFSQFYDQGTTTITFADAWQWKGISLAEGDLVSDETAKTVDDSGVTYGDYSNYDYLCVKYSKSTCEVGLIIQYNATGEYGQWGPNFNQGETVVPAKSNEGFVGLALDETRSDKLYSIALQNHAAGAITIEEIYFASEEEYLEEAAKVVPEATHELTIASCTGGWNDGEREMNNETGECTLLAANAAQGWWLDSYDASDFDNFVLEVTVTEIPEVEDTDNGGMKAGYLNTSVQYKSDSSVGTAALYVGDNIAVIALDEAKKNSIQQVWIQGSKGAKFTIKKAYFANAASTPEAVVPTPSAITTIKAEQAENGVMYNLAGQQVSKNYKGVVIQNGKKFFNK